MKLLYVCVNVGSVCVTAVCVVLAKTGWRISLQWSEVMSNLKPSHNSAMGFSISAHLSDLWSNVLLDMKTQTNKMNVSPSITAAISHQYHIWLRCKRNLEITKVRHHLSSYTQQEERLSLQFWPSPLQELCIVMEMRSKCLSLAEGHRWEWILYLSGAREDKRKWSCIIYNDMMCHWCHICHSKWVKNVLNSSNSSFC